MLEPLEDVGNIITGGWLKMLFAVKYQHHSISTSMFDADSPFIDDRSSSVASIENNGSTLDTPHSTQSAENSQTMSHPKKKSTQRSQVCEFLDSEKGQCKQRAIVSYKFCIRHILNDPNAPYKRCEMMAKSKKGNQQKLCTNAIKIGLNQIYCSTHLIMRGEMEPKKRKKNGQAASEGSDIAPPSNTQDSSCFGDDDHRTTISDADFNEIRQSPHAFTPDNEFIMPPTSSNNYPNPLITKSPLIRTPIQNSNGSSQMIMDMSPRPILKSPANNITQHQVIVPLQQNGITTRIIPTPHNSSSPHLAAHLIQTTSQKPLIYNQNDLIMSEHPHSQPNDSPRIKIQSADLNGHQTITLVNGQNGQFHNGSPIVQRIEVTELPPNQQPKPIVRILSKKNPLEFFDNNPPLILYDLKSVKVDDEISEKERLKRDYMSEHFVKPKKAKMIKLHQKRQRVKTEGKFRNIPNVDSMCQLVEDFDFDNTDLFPLGLEPSDDESLSDDDVELSHLPPINVNPYDLKSSRIELYLMKKRLRRESEKLQRNAKLSMTIMQAAKSFPDSVGTALRIRKMGRKRRNLNGTNSSLQQCFYTERGTRNRCLNICVPRSSLCATHIGYNVDQKAFIFCKTPCCGKPVSKLNSLVFNGVCEEHYLNGGKIDTTTTQRPAFQRQQFANSSTHTQTIYRPLHHRDSSVSVTIEQLPGSTYSENHNENFVENQLINSISMDDFTDVVEGDVSLASVANELLFDNHALNDMLAQFPVEEPPAEDHSAADLDDSDNLLSVFSREMHSAEPDMDQSWADISEFLRSEGYERNYGR